MSRKGANMTKTEEIKALQDAVSEIINDIRDCISVEGYWAITERLKKLPSVTRQTEITRESAIDYLHKIGWMQEHDRILSERQTGKWITTRTFMHDGEFYCSKCKCDAPQNERWDFCPNCGAKMVATGK
jgi:hypothetical protein